MCIVTSYLIDNVQFYVFMNQWKKRFERRPCTLETGRAFGRLASQHSCLVWFALAGSRDLHYQLRLLLLAEHPQEKVFKQLLIVRNTEGSLGAVSRCSCNIDKRSQRVCAYVARSEGISDVVDDMVLYNSITMVVHLEGIRGIQRFLNTGGASPGNSKEIL